MMSLRLSLGRPAAIRRRFDLSSVLAISFLAVVVLASLLAPWVAPYSPIEQDYTQMLAPPSAAHLLGTDDLGRDVFSRLIHGGKASLFGALLAVLVGTLIGVPVGLIAGFRGGWIDDVIGRLLDTLLSFPAIVLAVAITGALGIGLTNGMIAVGVVFSPVLARLARAQAMVVKQELYVDAARSFGATNTRILWRHVLPNAVQPLIVQVTLMLAVALLAEASLSFLGLGVQPPWPSWGAMLTRAYHYMEAAPEQMFAPGLAILLTALAFNALGETVRVLLDPTN
ncbi:ABC transporter permease [Vineibacter terrae]|uniref:ABC transporter permease n=1 Tax=Vineibacter terrae TaxID=2586908 RepID=A0A5C8PKJ7_9HYPH|nr:ABC transporter permease [Vineibacter terrae]